MQVYKRMHPRVQNCDACPPCVYCPEPGNLTPVRDSPAIPRLRSVNSYTNIRAATTARNLNKSLQNLNLNEEGRREKEC